MATVVPILPLQPKWTISLLQARGPGVRIRLDIGQDHPRAPFVEVLRESLAQEEALFEGEADVVIRGQIEGNGYADVYYRADLTASVGDETLFVLDDRPIHGDRPRNLSLEVVQRLKTEWSKRERRRAVQELSEP